MGTRDTGPFSSAGYSKLYFSALRAYITNAFSKVSVSLGDINGNWVQRLIYHDTGRIAWRILMLLAPVIFYHKLGKYKLLLNIGSRFRRHKGEA